MPFSPKAKAATIVAAVRGAVYELGRQSESFLGLPAKKFNELLVTSEVMWAPDGDAAFDDGGHVLQFDDVSEMPAAWSTTQTHRKHRKRSNEYIWYTRKTKSCKASLTFPQPVTLSCPCMHAAE